MSKLKNIEAIQKMLQGTHRTQTKKTFYMGGGENEAERRKSRNEGEIWEEVNRNTGKSEKWQKLNGIKVRYLSDAEKNIQENVQIMRSFYNCPKDQCSGNQYGNRLDEKFRRKTGMCFNCVVEQETNLRLQGRDKFDEYANKKMYENAVSYFRDLEQELEEKIADLKENRMGYVLNADGLEEKWSVEGGEAIANRLRIDLQEYKEMVLSNFSKKEEVVES